MPKVILSTEKQIEALKDMELTVEQLAYQLGRILGCHYKNGAVKSARLEDIIEKCKLVNTKKGEKICVSALDRYAHGYHQPGVRDAFNAAGFTKIKFIPRSVDILSDKLAKSIADGIKKDERIAELERQITEYQSIIENGLFDIVSNKVSNGVSNLFHDVKVHNTGKRPGRKSKEAR